MNLIQNLIPDNFSKNILYYTGCALITAAGAEVTNKIVGIALLHIGFGETTVALTLLTTKSIRDLSLTFVGYGAIFYGVYRTPVPEDTRS